jgi:uncharacterized protein YndB with AHSA1/START domain
MENQPIVIEQMLNAPVSKVWSAITDKDEMEIWYFDLKEFKAEPGFQFEFAGGPSPERQYVHHCEITEVIPESKLTYSWSYNGYAGRSYVSFELFPKEEQTLIRLTHSELETFPQQNPDFAKANFEQGWNEIISSSLKNYLEREVGISNS